MAQFVSNTRMQRQVLREARLGYARNVAESNVAMVVGLCNTESNPEC